MIHSVVTVTIAALSGLVSPSIAATLTIETFDPPNSIHTVGMGINSSGYVTGVFTDSGANFKRRGFLRYDNGDIAVFDVPGSDDTVPVAINTGGKITGSYRQVNGTASLPFIRDARGGFTTFSSPLGTLTPSGINDLGAVVGVIAVSNTLTKGFVRNAKGQITVFSPDGATDVSSVRINNAGVITGSFLRNGAGHAFIRDHFGNFTVFDAPNSVTTIPAGINIAGQVTGVYIDKAFAPHGFLRSPQGAMELLDIPMPTCINDFGRIAGSYQAPNQPARAFEREESGRLILIEAPNASVTNVNAISLNSDVAGSFKDAVRGGATHGLVVWVQD